MYEPTISKIFLITIFFLLSVNCILLYLKLYNLNEKPTIRFYTFSKFNISLMCLTALLSGNLIYNLTSSNPYFVELLFIVNLIFAILINSIMVNFKAQVSFGFDKIKKGRGLIFDINVKKHYFILTINYKGMKQKLYLFNVDLSSFKENFSDFINLCN